MTGKNALAELAERIAVVTSRGGDTWRWLKDVDKAQRIIAELAKVSSGHWKNICHRPPAYICDASDFKVGCCIGRCRAIAEEGDRNER